jgi:hypothetical protein
MALVGCGHDIGKKIEHGDIDWPRLVDVEIAQEDGQVQTALGKGPVASR